MSDSCSLFSTADYLARSFRCVLSRVALACVRRWFRPHLPALTRLSISPTVGFSLSEWCREAGSAAARARLPLRLPLTVSVPVLGVTILLSLTVFLNMVAESMPTTSDAVPLIGKNLCVAAP